MFRIGVRDPITIVQNFESFLKHQDRSREKETCQKYRMEGRQKWPHSVKSGRFFPLQTPRDQASLYKTKQSVMQVSINLIVNTDPVPNPGYVAL